MIVSISYIQWIIFINENISRIIELITFSISTCYNCSMLITSFPSSYFVLLLIRNIQRSIFIHCLTLTVNIRDNSTSICIILMKLPRYSSISSIRDNKTITLFINNHISWTNQLSISFISTCNYFTLLWIRIPCNNTIIPTIININGLIIINKYPTREMEFI
jgi:hypothetical protein